MGDPDGIKIAGLIPVVCQREARRLFYPCRTLDPWFLFSVFLWHNPELTVGSTNLGVDALAQYTFADRCVTLGVRCGHDDRW